MIRQYLSNTNESATVSIFQNFPELNKASEAQKFQETKQAGESGYHFAVSDTIASLY
jgi:hypothetical protein